jgi:Activator of Hsp90 ATPase homolog 1-like protein
LRILGTQGEALITYILVEQSGKTTLTLTVLYESREARDGVLKTPMNKGVAMSFDRLEELLGSRGARGSEKGASSS